MKHKMHFATLALALASLASTGQAWAQETKTVYGIVDTENYATKGIYTFELGDTISNMNLLQEMTFDRVSGGLVMGDTYYYMEYSQVYNGYKSIGLYAYDLESKTTKQIADYQSELNGTNIASCFSYDYASETMYALHSFNGGSGLVNVNLEDGTVTTVGTVELDHMNAAAQTYGYDNLHVMASNYDGDFYAVSYWGALYKVNPHSCKATYIADLDYNPGNAFMYTGDALFFDNDNDKLYLRFTTYDWNTYTWLYELCEVDKKTAHVTRIAYTSTQGVLTSLNSISMPFTVASASAPAKVQNLSVTRGEAGALTATLSWDNPSKTYGRGGTLEDLDYVLVYRDGELVDSLINPTIGGHETWVDNNITERGYYTYKLVPGNDVGRGDRTSVGTYVGQGDPKAVTDIKLEKNGDNARLSWTAPTEGTLDSYIDVATLKYDIVRYKNSDTTGETVATDYTGTTYDDELTEMAKYTYAVTPKTANATGNATKSETVILGPAFTVPSAFAFNSSDEFDLWTVIDANGNDYTWMYSQGYYGSMKGAYCTYAYDQLAAADWLISPRVKLEAGKRYKMTFDAQPGNAKVHETLAISLGQGTEIADQDSINQFELLTSDVVNLRANLPEISKTDEYNLGFFYRSYQETGYKLTIGNVQISEDHEGYITGTITCGGQPVAGATVIANGGEFTATTDSEGKYTLSYLPAGSYTVEVIAKGYENASQDATVAELDTTTANITLTALDTYTVKGQVADVAGDPVANATVTLSGYDDRETSTDATGAFSFANVYKNSNYAVTVVKNKLVDAEKSFSVDADTDLGTITMSDKQKPAGAVTVTADATAAEVTWKAPANDAVEQRIDDGTLTTAVGIADPTTNTMFGVVKREPSSIEGVKFYIDGTSSITHYSVRLNIFDLDENGNPTANLLYQNTYVPATDGKWNSYTLPAPVDAPNGYYIALSSYDYMLVGIDGDGDAEKYPFVEGVNCFTRDYTTGNYYYLEGQSSEKYHHNFLIRPIAAPYEVAEDSTEFTGSKANRFYYKQDLEADQPELDSKNYESSEIAEPSAALRTPQSRIRYNVYRMKTTDTADESQWTLLSEKQQARSYSDNDWNSLAKGTYRYAVKAVYTTDQLTAATLSDSIGNKMHTTVTVHVSTDTPDDESYGANVMLIAGGGAHVYQATVDDNGDVTFDKVWKTKYDITVSLDGFKSQMTTVDFSDEDSYSLSYTLEENRVQPYHLIIDEVAPATRLFMWNYADAFEDDFEGHEDFAINSPGTIGWQYIDGDGAETGGFSGVTWENEFKPMAYMVFNAEAAGVTDYTGLLPYSGSKCLTDWAAYNVPNDDWIITPKLHFDEDFTFSFYAASYTYGYNEAFEVAYSTTDADPSSFTVVESTTAPSYWSKYSYSIPKEAKYVGIHCTSDQLRIFRIDDVRYGLNSAMNAPAYVYKAAPVTKKVNSSAHRSAALDGLYEVYLDGEKVAQQDETEYIFAGLTAGNHTAGVLASYTSGKTEMSTIDFYIDPTGIATINGTGRKAVIDGRTLTIDGNYDRVALYATSGAAMRITKTGDGTYSLGNIAPGAYLLSVSSNGKAETIKITVK